MGLLVAVPQHCISNVTLKPNYMNCVAQIGAMNPAYINYRNKLILEHVRRLLFLSEKAVYCIVFSCLSSDCAFVRHGHCDLLAQRSLERRRDYGMLLPDVAVWCLWQDLK